MFLVGLFYQVSSNWIFGHTGFLFTVLFMLQAAQAKANGNAAYKKKDFVTAHAEYDKAIELDPSDMTFYNNKGGVYMF